MRIHGVASLLQHFIWKRASKHILSCLVPWVVVVVQLVEWPLEVSEIRGSIPIIGKIISTYLSTSCVIEKMKIKKCVKKILSGSCLPNSREGQRNLSEYWYLLQCREESNPGCLGSKRALYPMRHCFSDTS